MIKAVLLDLDGVLVEARDWHFIALNTALKEISGTEISLEEHLSDFNGLPTFKKLDMLVKAGRVRADDINKIWQLKQDVTVDTIKQMGKHDEEKIELMRSLKTSGILVACVTNSIRMTAEMMLTVTGQIYFIDLLVSNEDVVKQKPEAEGYIKAMVKFSCNPQDTLIVEDSDFGIMAAEKACANIMRVTCAADVTKEAVFREIEKYGI